MAAQRAAAKHSDLIYDVGMHKGEDTAFYLEKGFRVVGVEAKPALVAHCRQRFADEVGNGQLTIVEGAIVGPDHRGDTVSFYRNDSLSVWGTISGAWAARNETLGAPSSVIELPAIDFRDCLERHGVPHYLKVDIEGADLVCVSALEAFEARPSYLSIEAEKVSFRRLEAEVRTLASLGYACFKAVQQLTVQAAVEPNPALEGRYSHHRLEEECSGLFGRELPGAWRDVEQILADYRRIFARYEWLGDDGRLKRTWPGRAALRLLEMLPGDWSPGWYDTHAKHASA